MSTTSIAPELSAILKDPLNWPIEGDLIGTLLPYSYQNRLGEGAQGAVYANPQNPYSVIKVAHPDTTESIRRELRFVMMFEDEDHLGFSNTALRNTLRLPRVLSHGFDHKNRAYIEYERAPEMNALDLLKNIRQMHSRIEQTAINELQKRRGIEHLRLMQMEYVLVMSQANDFYAKNLIRGIITADVDLADLCISYTEDGPQVIKIDNGVYFDRGFPYKQYGQFEMHMDRQTGKPFYLVAENRVSERNYKTLLRNMAKDSFSASKYNPDKEKSEIEAEIGEVVMQVLNRSTNLSPELDTVESQCIAIAEILSFTNCLQALSLWTQVKASGIVEAGKIPVYVDEIPAEFTNIIDQIYQMPDISEDMKLKLISAMTEFTDEVFIAFYTEFKLQNRGQLAFVRYDEALEKWTKIKSDLRASMQK